PHHEDRAVHLARTDPVRSDDRAEPPPEGCALVRRQHRPRGDGSHPIADLLTPLGGHPRCDRERERTLMLTPPETDRGAGSAGDPVSGDLEGRFGFSRAQELTPERRVL